MKKLQIFLLVLVLLASPAFALATVTLQDGQYTVEVTLAGGSGRAGVASPAIMTVANGLATATVIWSSPYYEYMRVDGILYDPVNTDGNSTFQIPVTLDKETPVTAQTVAMSQPHEIDYSLYFDSATLKPRSLETTRVARFSGSAAVVLLILSTILWTRRKRSGKNRGQAA